MNADNDNEFWNYTFHEIGLYDIPAIIDHILSVTGQPSLSYIGHSQGCTIFFVMASERPEYLQKVRFMHAMAPAVFLPMSQAAFGFLLEFVDPFEVRVYI